MNPKRLLLAMAPLLLAVLLFAGARAKEEELAVTAGEVTVTDAPAVRAADTIRRSPAGKFAWLKEEELDILDADSLDFTVCWGDVELSKKLKSQMTSSVEAFTSEGYDTGFLLYDLNSGQGISYQADKSFYCASTIKGPYVASLAMTIPDDLASCKGIVSETIEFSSNEGYAYLWETYGTDEFQEWVEEAGCKDVDTNRKYPSITAKELARMWIEMYGYFSEEDTEDAWVKQLYTDTLNSCIYETLGDTYTVYSKAGWIDEEGYCVQNDAGIVMKDEHPYVLVVLSSAYDQEKLLDNLTACADKAHSYLVLTESVKILKR